MIGVSTPPPTPAVLAQGAHFAAWGVPPPPLLSQGVPLPTSPAGRALGALVGACCMPPLLRPLAARWGIPLPGRGVLLYPLAARGKCGMLCERSPLLLRPLATRWGIARPGQGAPLPFLAVCGKHMLMSRGSPPLSPVLDARVNRALTFRGSSLLFLALWLAAR